MNPLQDLSHVIDFLRHRTDRHGWYVGSLQDVSDQGFWWVAGECLLESSRDFSRRMRLSFLADVLEDAVWAVSAAPYSLPEDSAAVRPHQLCLGDRWDLDLVAFLARLHAGADPELVLATEEEWTPAAWWACTDLDRMLRALRGRVSPRKMRLIACAFARHALGGRDDRRGLRAIETAERHADGLATEKELWAARGVPGLPGKLAYDSLREALTVAARHGDPAELCDLVREVVGDPLHPPMWNPDWLRWHDGCVEKIVRSIFRGQRFAEMPILGDALEDAGCADAAVLAHCRQARNHARGCWVVDHLLGRS
jgi:hypothetical protein